MRPIRRRAAGAAALVLLLLLTAGFAAAAEFRGRRAIATPTPSAGTASPTPSSSFVPVDPRIVRDAVERLYAAYSHDSARLAGLFDDAFNDRSRVLDNIATQIPRDARLSVLGIEAIQTLEQSEGRIPTRPDRFRESRVAVVVRGQIEFDHPALGFVRRRGVSEFILKVYEPVP